jgi:hypothetical protein
VLLGPNENVLVLDVFRINDVGDSGEQRGMRTERTDHTPRRRKAPEQPLEPLIVSARAAAQALGNIGIAKVKALGQRGLLDLVMLGTQHFYTTASIRRFAAGGGSAEVTNRRPQKRVSERGEGPRPEPIEPLRPGAEGAVGGTKRDALLAMPKG